METSNRDNRPRAAVKATTDQYIAIDIRQWNREDRLAHGSEFVWYFREGVVELGSLNVEVRRQQVILSFEYSSGNHVFQTVKQLVSLSYSNCQFGGDRPWFLCPGTGCGTRVAKLYGSKLFVCRRCLNLAYQSQRERNRERLIRRAQDARITLGGRPNLFEPIPPRPKWMRWHKYQTLRTLAEQGTHLALNVWRARLNASDDDTYA